MAYALQQYDFSRYYGMNNSVGSSEVRPFEAEEIVNFLVRTQGKLTRRDGATLVGDDTGSNKILGLSHLYSGTNVQIRVENQSIKKLSAGSWTALAGADATNLTAGLDMNFVQANGYLYGFNGTDTVRKIDGTNVTTVAGIPKGTFGVWYRNFLIVGGVPANPNRLYISNLGNPEVFGASDYIDIELGTGDYLTGACAQTERLTITALRSCHTMTGSGLSSFAVALVTREFGIASHRSLVEVGEDVWGVDGEGRIRSVYRNQYGLFSGKDMSSEYLEQTTRGLNKQYLNKSCAAFINGYVLFAVPNGSSVYNNLVIVYDSFAPIPANKSRWTLIEGWSPSVFDVYDDGSGKVLYWGEGQADSKTYKWSGNTDNGTAISARWVGPTLDYGFAAQDKRFRQVRLFAEPLGDYDVTVSASIDGDTFTNLGELNLTSLGSIWGTFIWGTGVWGGGGRLNKRFHYSNLGGKVRGKQAQLKFEFSGTGGPCEIDRHILYYQLYKWT